MAARTLGVWRGSALYVGSLIGPGVLLLPALAFQAAGPASVVAWALLLVLSAPLAYVFATLATRMPVTAGVSAYVQRGLGVAAGAVTGGWFVTAVLIGAPAVSLIGAYYVAALTGSGASVTDIVGLAMFAVVVGTNMAGLRLSSRLQLLAAAVLTLVIAVAVAATLPSHATLHWRPFAPHGWWAVGTAASLLVWLFVGWEAVAQLAADFERPATQLPRAMLIAFVVVTILYIGLAVATVGVSGAAPSNVPLADLIAVGFGSWSRHVTAVLAVALTMATMNVYLASASKLAASLAVSGSLPRWLAGDAHRTIPRRPLMVIGAVGLIVMAALVAGAGQPADLVRATSACFVMVYVVVSVSAVRLLEGTARLAAIVATLMTAAEAAGTSRNHPEKAATAAVISVATIAARRAVPARSRTADTDTTTYTMTKHAEVARTRSAGWPAPATSAAITMSPTAPMTISGRLGMVRCASPASQRGSDPAAASDAASLDALAR